MDLCELQASLAYRVSSRAARATQGNPAWEQKTRQNNQPKKKKKKKKTHTDNASGVVVSLGGKTYGSCLCFSAASGPAVSVAGTSPRET